MDTIRPVTHKRVLLLVETSRAAGRGIIEGVSQYVIERQHWLIHLNEGHLHDMPPWLLSWKGDGIISRTVNAETNQILKKKRIPRVELHGNNIDFLNEVKVNESRIAELAADHLWDQGFRHFAVFGLGNAWWIEQRRTCFVEALLKYGTKPLVFRVPDIGEVFPSLIVNEPLMKKIVRWIRSLPKPVGIWGVTDLNAFYIVEACLHAGISIPEEVAVLGTDNDPLFCKALNPQLSSIDINAREIGYQAAILLDKKMNRQGVSVPIVTEPSHVEVRQSTDIIAVHDRHIARALSYIKERSSSSSLCAKEIARWSGTSLRSLQSKFRRHLDSTLEEQIAKCRIAHACRLLRDSDIKISSIPALIGFTSDSYFFTLFRKHQQVTPQSYRKMQREGSNIVCQVQVERLC